MRLYSSCKFKPNLLFLLLYIYRSLLYKNTFFQNVLYFVESAKMLFFAAARMMNLDLKDGCEHDVDLALVFDDQRHHNSLLTKMNTLRKGTKSCLSLFFYYNNYL